MSLIGPFRVSCPKKQVPLTLVRPHSRRGGERRGEERGGEERARERGGCVYVGALGRTEVEESDW